MDGFPSLAPAAAGRPVVIEFKSIHKSYRVRSAQIPALAGVELSIAEGEVFLMNPDVGDSLDGRYFGPLPTRAVIGKATPLYTDEDGDGRFVWRAATR